MALGTPFCRRYSSSDARSDQATRCRLIASNAESIKPVEVYGSLPRVLCLRVSRQRGAALATEQFDRISVSDSLDIWLSLAYISV